MRDGWYPVMSRGNGGEVIYRTDEDLRRFLGRVAELPDRFGTETHVFVLMDSRDELSEGKWSNNQYLTPVPHSKNASGRGRVVAELHPLPKRDDKSGGIVWWNLSRRR